MIRVYLQRIKDQFCFSMFQVKNIPDLSFGSLEEAFLLLERQPAHPVLCNNWPGQYPYSPKVSFRIAHNGKAVFLRFDVSENHTLALVKEDNGKVHTDSCVELFLATDDTGYYNFEFNCIGKAHLGFRKERNRAVIADNAVLDSIKRLSSLGTETFPETREETSWSLLVCIPVTALFRHHYEDFCGLKARCNLYKCGDHLSQPHFLSWQPIDTSAPDFHVPRFFTEIIFQ